MVGGRGGHHHDQGRQNGKSRNAPGHLSEVTSAALRQVPSSGLIAVWAAYSHLQMRLTLASLLGLVFVSLALAASSGRVIVSNGVRFVVPAGWQRVRAASPGAVTDPRTVLVVGTAGVRPKASACLDASYRVPAAGGVVVVVGWKSVASAGGGSPTPGRAPLKKLVAVRRHLSECFAGRSDVADVLLGGKPYQVNIFVGDRASKRRVREALAVGRSFDLAH